MEAALNVRWRVIAILTNLPGVVLFVHTRLFGLVYARLHLL